MKRTDLTMGAKVLYALLRDSAGRKDHCWPSQAYLASSLKQTIRSVQNHLRRLSELGLVSIRKRPWRGNVYYIVEQQAAASPKPAHAAPAPATASPKPMADAAPSGRAQASPSTPYNRQAADAAFERLWDAFPRSEARKPALRYWHRISRAGSAPSVEFLLASIKDNIERNPRWKRGFAPFLITWLKDCRWEDPLPALEEKPATSTTSHQPPALAPASSHAPDCQEKTVLLQKKEQEASAPVLHLPDSALARLKDALTLWPDSLNDAETAMVRVLWGRLHNENRLPSQETISDAVKSLRINFTRWLNQLYLHGEAFSS